MDNVIVLDDRRGKPSTQPTGDDELVERMFQFIKEELDAPELSYSARRRAARAAFRRALLYLR